MLARIQRLIALCLLGATCAAVWLAVRFDRPALWAVPAIIVVGYAGALAIEFWLLRCSYSAADHDRPDSAQLAHAWAVEALAASRVFLWRQPFRSTAEPDHVAGDSVGRRGIVFVHGFFCNRGLWNPWLRRFRKAGIPFIAVNLEPLFGSIDDYAPSIEAAVRELERATGLAPIIVAHSMGGLAARAWLAGAAPGKRVDRVVTIATPHAGTRIARRGFGANVAQMRPEGVWLERLRAREPAGLRARFICFWSHCDNIVSPTRHATLPGADNRHLPATPHVQMAYHPAVIDEVLRVLALDRPHPRPSLG
jgi:triacylglycerol lipase